MSILGTELYFSLILKRITVKPSQRKKNTESKKTHQLVKFVIKFF